MNTLRIYCIVFLLFFSHLAFCQKTKVENIVAYKAVGLSKNDAKFLALKDTARKYVDIFMDSLKKHGADYQNYRFLIKSDFAEKDVHEHMWSQVVGDSKGNFLAVFIDSPFDLKNMKTGDNVVIAKSSIEDWAIYDKNNVKIGGNFSEKYLNSKLVK